MQKEWFMSKKDWEKIKKEAKRKGIDLGEGEILADKMVEGREKRKWVKEAARKVQVQKTKKVPAKKPETIIGGPRKGIAQDKKRMRRVEKYMSEGLTDRQANHAADLKDEKTRDKYIAECKIKNKQEQRR